MIASGYDLCVPVNRFTAVQAAAILGVSKRRVNAMIQAGRLRAEKIGNLFLIKPSDLEKVKNRTPGRPKSAKRPPPRPAKPKGR